MAGEDYSIKTKVQADVSNFEKGMNKAEKSLKGFSNKLADSINRLGKKGLVGSIANVTLAMNGLTKSFSTVINVAKNVGKTISENTEAYKKQLIVEKQLSVAIDNNPLVDRSSFIALKDFASAIQKVSNYGDEELIPMMTDLIAKGRTEAETMKIVTTAVDMSADGTISLESAVSQLNMTLNGSIGRLGQQYAELKNLTEEQLKSGDAIEILGKKFEGLAKATVDTSKQLKNIKGDFKEALGEFTLPTSDVWNKFWSGFYERGIIVIKRINDSVQLKTDYKATQEFVNAYADAFKRMKPIERTAEWAKITAGLDDSNIKYMTEALQHQLEKQGGLKTLELEFLKALENEVLLRREAQVIAERTKTTTSESSEAEKEKNKSLEEQKTIEEKIGELKYKYLQKIKLQETEWKNIKLVTGEAVKNEERLKFYQNQLVAIMTESGGQITTNNEYFKQQLAIIQQIIKEMKDAEAGEEEPEETGFYAELMAKIKAFIQSITNRVSGWVSEVYDKVYKSTIQKLIDLIPDDVKDKLNKAFDVVKNVMGKINNVVKKSFELGKKIFKTTITFFAVGIKGMVKVVSTVTKTISSLLSSAFGVFKKIININFSDVLDTLLAFEDAVLTFFIETLPQLPAYVSAILKSINILLKTLLNSVKKENIATVLFGMLDTLKEELPDLMESISTMLKNSTEFMTENLSTLIFDFLTLLGDNVPQVINDLLDLLSTTISEGVKGIIQWLDEGGLQIILQMLLDLQTKLQDLVLDLLSQIATFLSEHTEDFGAFLADSLTNAFNALPELIDSLLKIITALIQAIADAFKDKEMIQAMVDGLVGGIEAILDNLGDIVSAVIDLIFSVITAIVPKLPEIILKIIGAIAKALPDLVSDIAGALGDGIKSIFNKDFWVDTLKTFKETLANIVKSVFSGIGKLFDISDTTSSGKKKSKVEKGWDIGLGIATGGVYNLGKGIGKLLHWWADGTDNAPAGLSVVGEAGPELVNFKGGEQVLSNANTKKLLSGSSGTTVNQNITFNNLQDTSAYEMINQLKQYNRSLAINGII